VINKSGIAHCHADCIAESDVTIKIVGNLQPYASGSWLCVTSWTTTGVGIAVLDKAWIAGSDCHAPYKAKPERMKSSVGFRLYGAIFVLVVPLCTA